MTDDDLISQLEAATFPENHFHHDTHVRAASIYLTRFPLAEAVSRFTRTLRTYVASLGKPDRYHETTTYAYLLLINERLHRSETAIAWQEFAIANPDLLDYKRSILSRYYHAETLQSDLARKTFVMPDRLLPKIPEIEFPKLIPEIGSA